MVDETKLKHKKTIYKPKVKPQKLQTTKSTSGHV